MNPILIIKQRNLFVACTAMRFKNSTIWVQIVFCECIVLLFLVSHFEVI